ncbi:MAG: hypothetical protein JJE35_01790 [Thermoleophilia bacterium]|nr:hypothetical protein [Thermoleophilia bacterium]
MALAGVSPLAAGFPAAFSDPFVTMGFEGAAALLGGAGCVSFAGFDGSAGFAG